ncbi:MAG TPA: hypothetical protein VMZ52_10120 [Bryobacteraceae bacterium]|nr:hypothetical protein [Bryobacteraceae bacterium]
MRHSAILLLLAALIAFGGAVFAEFHFDDYAIFSDPVLTSATGWREVWLPLQTRPLTYFTFWINYALGGQRPAGYHAVNLGLHLACVWLVLDVLKRLVTPESAFLAAGIFALHPIQAEPVAYVFARATLLATLFCLLSLRAWTRGRYWTAVAWFAAALLAKEEVVAFPAFLLLLLLARRQSAGKLLPIGAMFVLAIAAGVRVMWAASRTPGSSAGAQSGYTMVQYFGAQGAVILRYLRLLLVPWGFSVDPEISSQANWWAWLLVLVAVAAAVYWFSRPAAFWFLTGFVLLLPSSSIFPAADLAADRRMYFPLFAFATGFVLLCGSRIQPVLLVLLGLSILRSQVWRSEETLWREAVERAPGKVRPKIQLARSVPAPEALALLEDARRVAPDDPSVAAELGRVQLIAGSPEKALSEFGRALALQPNNPQAISNRGVALLLLKQTDAARRDFEKALAVNPCLFEARLNLLRMGVQADAPSGCRYSDDQRRVLTETRRF